MAAVSSPNVASVTVGGFAGDEDERRLVVNLLDAPDYAAAEAGAQEAAARALGAAGFPVRDLPVVYVTPTVPDADAGVPFLDAARELIDNEQYSLAVVAAQIHFESQLKLLLERAVDADTPPWVKSILQSRGVASLRKPLGHAVADFLLGLSPTLTPEWPTYRRHLDRRNAIAHEGATVSEADARESVAVVRALWMRFADSAKGS